MTIAIKPLAREHLADCAALAAARYRSQRLLTPDLPARYEAPDALLPRISELAAKAPGVVALWDGRVAGFLVGELIRPFGKRSAYTAEWGHGTEDRDRAEIYREMYTSLSAKWVANGCFTHLITVVAGDRDALDGLFQLGFGMIVVDAIRDLSPIPEDLSGVEIRRIGPEDAALAASLEHALQRHLAAAPAFVPFVQSEGPEVHREWLDEPKHAMWVAFQGKEPVGYIRFEPSNQHACDLIEDEGTMSCTGAFIQPEARNSGLSKALLNQGLAWAPSAGFTRCAVDFESANIPAARFWTRHFKPVCYSLSRHVDERVAWANERRRDCDIW